MLVDFWTFTCINWLRTLTATCAPGLEKYADHGLVVIGVHTPEFPFEADARQRRARRRADADRLSRSRSTRTTRCGRPSATTTGRRSTWPTPRARIQYHHFGEGGFDECERTIQRLLREAGHRRARRPVGGDRAGGRRGAGRLGRTCARPRPTSARSRAAISRARRGRGRVRLRRRLLGARNSLILNTWALSGRVDGSTTASRADPRRRRRAVPLPRARCQPGAPLGEWAARRLPT